MTNHTKWKQLNIYLTEGDRWQHQQLYTALVEAAHQQGLAGVTVMRAITGFGKKRKIRTTRLVDLSADLSVVVTIIDREEALAQFLPRIRAMVQSQFVTLQPIEVFNSDSESDS
jgi:PII-like signaling protein